MKRVECRLAVLGLAASAAFVAPSALAASDPAQWREALSFRTLSPHGHVGAPAVAGGRVFVETPFPHTLFALDAAHPDAPELWRYTPKPDGRAAGLACCGGAIGGPAVDGADVVMATVDGHVVALHAADGAVAWDVRIADPGKGETLRESPLVAEGKVFVGESGDDNGARGWVAALDEQTGRELWRRYATGPTRRSGFRPAQGAAPGRDELAAGRMAPRRRRPRGADPLRRQTRA